MTTITDVYGRAISVTADAGGLDVYATAGLSVSFPAGTPQAQALATLEGMAGAGWAAPQTWTFLQFMGLFTADEQTALVDSSDPQIRLYLIMAAGAQGIQLDNAEVVAGVDYAASIGLISTARAAQILAGAAPPSP